MSMSATVLACLKHSSLNEARTVVHDGLQVDDAEGQLGRVEYLASHIEGGEAEGACSSHSSASAGP